VANQYLKNTYLYLWVRGNNPQLLLEVAVVNVDIPSSGKHLLTLRAPMTGMGDFNPGRFLCNFPNESTLEVVRAKDRPDDYSTTDLVAILENCVLKKISIPYLVPMSMGDAGVVMITAELECDFSWTYEI
jgi:hypothetical protein